jgi:ATP synthase F1 gamma subunit
MKTNKKLLQGMKSLSNMMQVIQAYQEIAAMRMRRVKESVLQNRHFLEGLNEIYSQVDLSYRSEGAFLRKKNNSVVRKTNGKTVTLLLSANTGLYGDITRRTFDLFIADVKENDTDIVIIGKYGKRFFENSSLKKPFVYFDFSDTGLDDENTKDILKYVLNYEAIAIYHGFFKDVLVQEAIRTLVTGSLNRDLSKAAQPEFKYVYEPSIEEIMTFFEKEILSVVFNQSVFESSLSKFASRMISLDQATVKVKNVLKRTNFKIRKLRHKGADEAQLAVTSGISLWSSI